jgi:hypothetical protein
MGRWDAAVSSNKMFFSTEITDICRFLVDSQSDLCYDPHVLIEAQRRAEEEKGRETDELVYHHHHQPTQTLI